MPLIKLQVSPSLNKDGTNALLKAASQMLTRETGKPEAYVMATVEGTEAVFAGAEGPAAFVDVRGIGGFNKEVNNRITRALCALLHERAGIPPDRVYVTFTDVPASNWGWNNRTFG
jgi:phenylpyruvate tautomerase PptA (4-oxalocrotonate tautomerase family)